MKNQTLYIHVGMHKTGTSAIQKFIGLNIENFAKNGVYIPRQESYILGDKKIHHHIANLLKTNDEMAINNEIEKIRIASLDYNSILISSEVFNEIGITVEKIKKVFSTYYNKIKIIIYIRNQYEQISSAYNQIVKSELHTSKFNISNPPYRRLLDYFKLLNEYSHFFGKSNIIVEIYDKKILWGKNLIVNFIEKMGILNIQDFNMVEKAVNQSLNARELEFCRILNYFLPLKIKYQIVECFMEKSIKPQMNTSFLNEIETAEVFQKYKTSNELVNKYYVHSNTEIFSSQLNNETNTTFYLSDELNENDISDILNYIYSKNENLIEILYFHIRDVKVPHEKIFEKIKSNIIHLYHTI